jgi:hypothetical protein
MFGEEYRSARQGVQICSVLTVVSVVDPTDGRSRVAPSHNELIAVAHVIDWFRASDVELIKI